VKIIQISFTRLNTSVSTTAFLQHVKQGNAQDCDISDIQKV